MLVRWCCLCRWLSASGFIGLGRLLSLPFFRCCVPPYWEELPSGLWRRRYPPQSCGRGSFASGFRGCWRCFPVALLPSVASASFVWCVCPAVVVRRPWRSAGLVLWVWAFCSPAPGSTGESLRRDLAFEAAQKTAKLATRR